MTLRYLEKLDFAKARLCWFSVLLYVLTFVWLVLDHTEFTTVQTILLCSSILCAFFVSFYYSWVSAKGIDSVLLHVVSIVATAVPFVVVCLFTGGLYSPYSLLVLSYCIVHLVRMRHRIGQSVLIVLFTSALLVLFAAQIYVAVYNYTLAYFLFDHIEAIVQSIRRSPETFVFTFVLSIAYILSSIYFTRQDAVFDTHDVERGRILKTARSVILRINRHTRIQECYGDVVEFFDNASVPFEDICLYSHVHTDDQIILKECLHNPSAPRQFRMRFLSIHGNYRWVECTILQRRLRNKSVDLMIMPGMYNVTVPGQDDNNEHSIDHKVRAGLLANMSHELRTPLNAVIGFSQVIHDEMFGEVGSPKYIEYAKMIADSGNHMLCLINELLDLTHIERLGSRDSNIMPVLNWVNIDNLVNECVQLTTHRMKPIGGSITFDNLGKTNFNLLSDGAGLKQIIRALLAAALLRDGRVHNVHVTLQRLHTTLKITMRTEKCKEDQMLAQKSKSSLMYMSSLNMDVAQKHVQLISGNIRVYEQNHDKNDRNGYIILTVPHRRQSIVNNGTNTIAKYRKNKHRQHTDYQQYG